jgi:hypothetical protein
MANVGYARVSTRASLPGIIIPDTARESRRRPAHRRFRVTPAPTLRPPPRQGPQGRCRAAFESENAPVLATSCS